MILIDLVKRAQIHLTVDKPAPLLLRYQIRQAYDRPDIHKRELSGNVCELNGYQTVYVRQSSGVYQAHELNPGEAIDRILLHIARADFEQSYEPCRETTRERTIHILPTSLYPNTIVPTGQITE